MRNLAYTLHYVMTTDCRAPAGGQVARCAARAECVEGTSHEANRLAKKKKTGNGTPGRTRNRLYIRSGFNWLKK